MPYVVVLTTGESVSEPFRRLYDTLLSLKISVIKSGFSFDFVLKISYSHCSVSLQITSLGANHGMQSHKMVICWQILWTRYSMGGNEVLAGNMNGVGDIFK